MRVIVIGGGIGGQALGAALRLRDIDVSIYEQAAAFGDAGAALTLWPNGMKALRRLGAAPEARAAGWPILTSEIRRPDGHPLAVTPVDRVSDEAGAATIALRRSDLHRVLTDAAGPAATHFGKRCVSISQEEGGVRATMADGEVVTGDILVGADGLWSRVRQLLVGPARPRQLGCLWRGIVTLDDASLRAGHAFETWGTGKRFGMAQINRREVYWYAGLPDWPDEPFDRARWRILAEFGHWHAPLRRAVQETAPGAAMRTVIYDRPALRRWTHRRISLLGDAAHPMTPDLGQGACTALEDAVELADCLAEAESPNAALDAYAGRRRERCARLAARSRRMSEVAQWNSRVLCAARDLVTRIMPAPMLCRGLLGIVNPPH
jgi:2-polyprenyl-6-methoxyphenol hydroxylase-like FAD-dependent oxidoreductase